MRIHHLIMTAALFVILFMSRSIGSSQTNLESNVAGPIFLLSSDDYETRFKAGDALCKLGTNAAPAIPAIIRLLETNPDKFHDVMIRVLENCPNEAQAFKPTLEKNLQSPSPYIRINCARTLWVLDHSYADQARLVARKSLSESDAGIRVEGASLLWRLDHDAKAVVPTLIALLSDHDKAYEYRTIKFLGSIGPQAKEAIPAIQDWLKSGRMHEAFATNAAVVAIQKIEGKP
jgi:HEAT repeat protein